MEFERVKKSLAGILDEFSRAGEANFQDMVESFCLKMKEGGRIFVFGNGGSAAQAQHFSAEIVNKYLRERRPLPAFALTTDSSILTAVSNDFSFDRVFAVQLAAGGGAGDVALALSTSGFSPNIIAGLKEARRIGMMTAALVGCDGSRIEALTDWLISVPSKDTPRIQEVHLILLHLMAEKIEERLG